MRFITLLVGILLLSLFFIFWLRNPFSNLQNVKNYQDVNQQVENVQEQLDTYQIQLDEEQKYIQDMMP